MIDEIKYSKNTIEAKLNIVLFKEDDVWISWIPSLNISSYGDDKESSIKEVKEATLMFFDHILKKHVVFEALKELGWNLKKRVKEFLEWKNNKK